MTSKTSYELILKTNTMTEQLKKFVLAQKKNKVETV